MFRSFFLPLSSRLSSLRCRCSPPPGCSSRSSVETVFLKAARSLAHAGEAPPPSARGRLLTPPPPPSPLAAVTLPPDPGDRSGDQKSRCTEPGWQKPKTPAVTVHHTQTECSHTHEGINDTNKKTNVTIKTKQNKQKKMLPRRFSTFRQIRYMDINYDLSYSSLTHESIFSTVLGLTNLICHFTVSSSAMVSWDTTGKKKALPAVSHITIVGGSSQLHFLLPVFPEFGYICTKFLWKTLHVRWKWEEASGQRDGPWR